MNSVRKNVTIGGRTMHLTAWAREFGITHACLNGRLNAGWPEERLGEKSDGFRVAHGHSRRKRLSPEYRVWLSMVQRCTNPLVKVRLGMALYFVPAATRAEAVEIAKAKAKAEAARP